MNSIFFVIRYIIQDLFQFFLVLLLFTSSCFAAPISAKSLVRVRNFKYYRQMSMGQNELILDKTSKSIVFLIGTETLKVSKAKKNHFYTFSQNQNKMLKNLYFKKSESGAKSLIGLVTYPKIKMFFTNDEVKCFDKSNELLSFFKKEDFGKLVDAIQFSNFLDKESCSSIPLEKMDEMSTNLKDKFAYLNGNIKRCLNSADVQNILDNDFGLRENMILYVGRYLGVVNSFNKDSPRIKVTCAINSDRAKFASLDSKSSPPKLELFYNSGSFNLTENDVDNVLNHELFHYGVPQMRVGDQNCLDESYAKVITNLCSTTINLATAKIPSSKDILAACIGDAKKLERISVNSAILNRANVYSPGLGGMSAETISQMEASQPKVNKDLAANVAAQVTPQTFRTISDRDIDRALASVPILGTDGEQVSVPASVFGGSVERIFAAGELTMNDVGNAVTKSFNSVVTAATNKAVGDSGNNSDSGGGGSGIIHVAGNSFGTNSEISVYPLTSIVSDVYSTSPDRPTLVIPESPAAKLKQAPIQTQNLSSRGTSTATAVAVADTGSAAAPNLNTDSQIKAQMTSASVAAPVPKNSKTAAALAASGGARTIASAGANTPVKEIDKVVPASPAAGPTAVTPVDPRLSKVRVDNEYLQGLSVYKVISGTTYEKFKKYYKMADADLVNRGIFIYDKNNKPLAGVLTNAKICFRDVSDELKKENCPSIKKR